MKLSPKDKRIRFLTVPSIELGIYLGDLIDRYELELNDVIYILATYQMQFARQGMNQDGEVI